MPVWIAHASRLDVRSERLEKLNKRSKTLQRAVARVGNLEQGIELRELEQRFEIVVQVRQAELPALLTDLLRQRNEHAKSRAVDVSRLGEIDQELLFTALELIE